jgi:hypothetical protein
MTAAILPRVPTSSRKLFQSWAAKRRQVVELEDALAAADTAAGAPTTELAAELERVRAEAEQVLREALEAFHGELRERGLE